MTKRFKKGVEIVAIYTLIQALENNSWVFYRDRPLHPNFIRHMSLSTVLGGIKSGLFYQVKERPLKTEIK